MFASRFNTSKEKFSFRLINDRNVRLLRIGIYDINTKALIDSNVGYTYDCLEKIHEQKIKKSILMLVLKESTRTVKKNSTF